ncbi:Cytochrome c oxidase assembly factor 6 homolog [Trichuris trichiura]|uniref:Cytochrome c oxidase assembly factor 6 homolog n=1 Tax=Trichuris trichiura TaxID=36087 RepID=A0A077Z1M5_TRITR|nr:Cytochrome c oxidase assembly factor 6 homolog [Trichuris trichiura]
MSVQDDVPLLSERKKCWSSRDKYWSCLDDNNGDETKCKEQRAEFVSSCRRTWVEHFDRKYRFEKYKEEHGLQQGSPTPPKTLSE